mmetsp:Transcript_146361/g.469563  ORF Transcript_146361/g.469563 Transcript_146361/m.469563 type:complete len:310 (+) Transcript_146361:629-1558(+)
MSPSTGLPDMPHHTEVAWMLKASNSLGVSIAQVDVSETGQVYEPTVLSRPIPDRMTAPISLHESRPPGMQAHQVVAAVHALVLLRSLPAHELDGVWRHHALQGGVQGVTAPAGVPNVPLEAHGARVRRAVRVGVAVADVDVPEAVQVDEPPVPESPIADGALGIPLLIGYAPLVEPDKMILAVQREVLSARRSAHHLDGGWCRGDQNLRVPDVLLVLRLPDTPDELLAGWVHHPALLRVSIASVRLLQALAINQPSIRGRPVSEASPRPRLPVGGPPVEVGDAMVLALQILVLAVLVPPGHHDDIGDVI